MKRLNDKLLDAIGEILHRLLVDADAEDKIGDKKSDTFRSMYRGSAEGKREFVKTIFKILREKDIIDDDQLCIISVGLYIDTVPQRWAELAHEILEDAKRQDPR